MLFRSIQISQEADQVVWYSYLFQNFPQLIVIHTVKGFGIVNKAEESINQTLGGLGVADLMNMGYIILFMLLLKASFTKGTFSEHV